MLRFSLLKNSKAQVAETMTWVVATIIIIFLILSSIYIASLLGQNKNLKINKIETSKENNWIENKSEYAFDLNSENRAEIVLWLSENSLENLNSGGEDD